MRKEDFTFVIATFKSENIIFECLNNIPTESKKIIIENSGNYELKSNLENKYTNLECLVMKSNLGFGKANNIGIKRCLTKYIFILNPDVIMTNEKFNEILKKLKNEKFSVAAPIDRSNKTNFAGKDFLEVNEVRGFAMILDLKIAKKTLFDENIFLYLEEIDLCRRLKEKNIKIFLAENIFVKHLGGKSHNPDYQEKMEIQRNWHYLWSLFYFSKKHKGIFYAYKITLRKFISAFFKLIFYYFISKKKHLIYKHRFLGLLSSYLGKTSSFRIK